MEKMVKFFLISFIFFCCFHFTLALCPITPCCGHGHIEKTNLCVCMSTWTGINCDTQVSINKKFSSDFNESIFYDWREVHLRRRLPRLYNLDVSNTNQNDEEFPENYTSLNTTSIQNNWISIKNINSSYVFIRKSFNVTDVLQGGSPNCFFHSAIAAIANHPDGQLYLSNAFPYYNENSSIYVTKWFLLGRYVYVSVNDKIPGNINGSFVAQIPSSGVFWVAILEKAWAKIWGSYAGLLSSSEDLIWSALTGAIQKKVLEMNNVIFDSYDHLNVKIDFNKFKLATIKSNPSAFPYVPNHSYTILGVYKLKVFLDYPIVLFYLYNPWGINDADNVWNSANELFKAQNFTERNNIKFENNGKFFIEFNELGKYFDRIIAMAPQNTHSPVSFEIKLEKGILTTAKLNFNIENAENTFVFFDVFNDNYGVQIQNYKIKNLNISELEEVIDDNIENSYNGIYQGFLISHAKNKNTTISLNFSLEKFNFDIAESFFISFYTSSKLILLNNLTPIQTDCIISNSLFFPKVLLQPTIICDCNGNGFCLSTGKCKCFPGFDHATNCLPCKNFQTDEYCEAAKYNCYIQSWAKSDCAKTCLTGDCYFPGEQTKCQVNGCYGRGLCFPNGFCSCYAGFSGYWCENIN